MALGLFGPTGYGYRPRSVVVTDASGDHVQVRGPNGAPAPPNIDNLNRVSFYVEPGSYTLTLTKPDGTTETHPVTVTQLPTPPAPPGPVTTETDPVASAAVVTERTRAQAAEAAEVAARGALPTNTGGHLSARPANGSLPNGSTYFADDDNLGTTYRMQGGVWVKQAASVGDTGGRELGSTALASSFNSGNAVDTAMHDVTGLQVAVTVGSRPIKVRLDTGIAFQMGTSTAAIRRVNVQIVDVDTGTAIVNSAWTIKPTASTETWWLPLTISKRLTATAGVHTYKVQYSVNVVGAIISFTGPDLGGETLLEVVER